MEKSGKSFADAYPELLKEWNHTKNKLVPTELSPHSNYKAFWSCKYGHKWKATIDNRTSNGSNCPDCRPQSSRIEIYLLSELKCIFNGIKWRPKFGGFECDIYIPEIKLGIEVDGHYWHKDKLKNDHKKTKYFAKKGIHLIRVRESKLPFIEGSVVGFKHNEDLQKVTLALFHVINKNFRSDNLNAYLRDGLQKNASEYRKLVARLPAPPKEESLEYSYPIVASEWDYKKNHPLTPDLFSYGSDQKVAWLCHEGHRWETIIKHRTTNKSGCPKCAGRKTGDKIRKRRLEILGKSFIEDYPELLKEWDIKKNDGKNPEDYTYGSATKIWWKCNKGHSWQTSIKIRTTNGSGCPKCRIIQAAESTRLVKLKRTGSLADNHPEVAKFWHKKKNLKYSPKDLSSGSKIKVWWCCNNDHEWQESPNSRTDKRREIGCPTCRKLYK